MSLRRTPQRQHARYLYFRTALSQKAIAEAVGVSERSIYSWIRTEKWAEQKQATYYSPEQEVHQLFEQLRKLNEVIALRPDGIATKEDLDIKAKIAALITVHMKNAPANWRNIAAEYDSENKDLIDLNALGALERKNLEKRIAAAEEDARLGPGVRFSEEKMDDYYTKVAKISFGADSIASRTGKDGKPLPPDDPERLRAEALMRQGKRPFRKRNEEQNDESDEESGKEEADDDKE